MKSVNLKLSTKLFVTLILTSNFRANFILAYTIIMSVKAAVKKKNT